MNSKG